MIYPQTFRRSKLSDRKPISQYTRQTEANFSPPVCGTKKKRLTDPRAEIDNHPLKKTSSNPHFQVPNTVVCICNNNSILIRDKVSSEYTLPLNITQPINMDPNLSLMRILSYEFKPANINTLLTCQGYNHIRKKVLHILQDRSMECYLLQCMILYLYISFTQSCECNVMYINNPVTRKSRYTV